MPHTPTVLLVDDAPMNLATLDSLLTTSNIKVLVAENGEQALQRATSFIPDLILMDVMMPEMDGFEACRRLKQQESTKDIPVIFITSLIDQRSTLEGFAAGGVDYIAKPFNPKETLARVQTHLSLQRLRRELEAKNTELLDEIAKREQAEEEQRQLERQLRQSQRLKAIGTLAGGIAHDFNNILGTIQGYTEFLISKQSADSAEKIYLERIFNAGNRAATLVKRLLTFSRAHEQHLTPTPLPPVIAEALDMLRATIPATVELRRNIQPDCPSIPADAAQIHQTLVNLCINASQAMAAEGGILEIRLEAVGADKIPDMLRPEHAHSTYVLLTVRDTGCGMPPEVRERIFDPFFTTRATEGGTGLGLSMVHGIVQGHHGILHVESTPNAGTTFRIFFPADQTDIPETDSVSEQTTAVQTATTTPGKGGILVVDDEVDLAAILSLVLTEAGYQVQIRHNGAEALELFRARPDDFDLVLTDHAMPGLNGAQLSRELLTIKPELPIILATGYSERVSHNDALEIGIRHFLTKPVAMQNMLTVVQQLLE